MKILIDKKEGLTLKTKHKYCNDDIHIVVGEKLLDELSGVYKEIYSSDELDMLISSENIGKIYLYKGETNDKYVQGAMYLVEEE